MVADAATCFGVDFGENKHPWAFGLSRNDGSRTPKYIHRGAYDFIDVDQDADALRSVEQTNAGKRRRTAHVR